MTSETESIGQNESAQDAGRKSDIQVSDTKPNVSPALSVPKVSPTKTHCEITCKTEKNWWDKAKPFVEIAGIILLFVYTLYTIKMYCANRDAANAAKSAADTAHDALVLGQRPWIKIKHRIVKPLNFEFVGAAGPAATMTVEDTIENVGNGVALNVVSWEDVIPLDSNMATTSARNRQDQWCDANKRFDPKSPTQLNGYSLFPKDPLIQDSGIGPLMSTVRKAVENNTANMSFLHKGSDPNPLAGKVAFAMVGCIVYRSPLDPDGTRPYMTGFLYHLGEPDESGGIQPFVIPKGTAEKLRLVKFPDGDFAY